jgi:hypothetical protein
MTVWLMCFACWITKVTNTHWEYVILIASSLKQWLRERTSLLRLNVRCYIQGAYKMSDDFAKPYFHKYWTETHDVTTIWKWKVCGFISDHDVQIAVGTCVEPLQLCNIAQIPGHTNYARSVRQPFPSNTGLRFSREMAVATIGPFQMLPSLCVIDTNFTILRHSLLKLWRNEILR